MGFVVAFDLLLMAIFFHWRKKSFASPEVFFCYEWAIISFLASLQLYGIYSASTRTWAIVLVGSVSFVLGVTVIDYFPRRKKIENIVLTPVVIEKENNKRGIFARIKEHPWFWGLVAFLYISSFVDIGKTIYWLANGLTLEQIRILHFAPNNFVLEVYNDVFDALQTIVVAIFIKKFIDNVKENWWYIVLASGLVLTQAFSDGGRFIIAYLIVEILVCFLLFSKRNKNVIPRWFKLVILGSCGVLVISIFALTLLRGAPITEIVVKAYRYICGNIVFFDRHVVALDTSGFKSYSFASLYGIWSVILPILENGLGIAYPSIYLDTIAQVMNGQEFIQIGENMYTNAFITSFYHPYADFRWIGVIAGMFIFGLICGYLYKKAQAGGTFYTVTYLLFAQMIFKTFHCYPYSAKVYIYITLLLIVYKLFIKYKEKTLRKMEKEILKRLKQDNK